MTMRVPPSDLELAALISSRICHDAINPVGAISQGLQMLGDESDAAAQKLTIDMIRNVTAQASARIEFARIAYGASGTATTPIDLSKAEDVASRYVSPQIPASRNKHKLNWRVPACMVEKDKGKLLLNLIAAGLATLPRGGEVEALMTGTPAKPVFSVRCKGSNAKPPQALVAMLSDAEPEIDALNIQYYYLVRLAASARMALDVVKDGADVILVAR
jgi:histidine phosphotransferase ChpT